MGERSKRTQLLMQSALMLTIIIVLGFIPPISLGFIPVPVVLQNLGIMLAGVLLPFSYSLLTVGGFLALGLVGVPVLAGMRGGFPIFMGPTGGFLVGYLAAAIILPLVFKNQQKSLVINVIKMILAGIIPMYAFGIIGMALNMHITLIHAFELNMVFLPVDLCKSLLAVLVYERIRVGSFVKSI